MMRHCNSVFQAQDIWYLLDTEDKTDRKLYIANCPICNKRMALYSYLDIKGNFYFEKYFYSGGADKIKERLKKDVTATMLGFRDKYKAPSGFKYGKNVEVKRNGETIEIRQYACDFNGNKILVKRIERVEKSMNTSSLREKEENR